MDPLFQLAFLLYVWWFQVNWLVAYPFGGIGEDLPESLEHSHVGASARHPPPDRGPLCRVCRWADRGSGIDVEGAEYESRSRILA